jgi:hypothetical protein
LGARSRGLDHDTRLDMTAATRHITQALGDINEGSSLVCHPSWTRAPTAAQRLSDLARLRRVRDRMDREYAQPLDVEALAAART